MDVFRPVRTFRCGFLSIGVGANGFEARWRLNFFLSLSQSSFPFFLFFSLFAGVFGRAKCHGPTFFTVRCCDLDTLTTSLKEIKPHIYFSPRLCGFVGP